MAKTSFEEDKGLRDSYFFSLEASVIPNSGDLSQVEEGRRERYKEEGDKEKERKKGRGRAEWGKNTLQ